MFEPPLIETLVPWFGVGMFVVGFVWMVRLSRPDPEAGERTWRYRIYE
jgi:type IV secretory pathway TrbD component